MEVVEIQTQAFVRLSGSRLQAQDSLDALVKCHEGRMAVKYLGILWHVAERPTTQAPDGPWWGTWTLDTMMFPANGEAAVGFDLDALLKRLEV